MPSYKRPECTLDVEDQYAYYDTWQLEPPPVAPDPIQEVAPAQAQPWASASVEDTASIPALLTASPEPQPSEGTDAFFAAVNLMAEVEKLAEGRSQTSKLKMLAAVAVGFAQANERIYGMLSPLAKQHQADDYLCLQGNPEAPSPRLAL